MEGRGKPLGVRGIKKAYFDFTYVIEGLEKGNSERGKSLKPRGNVPQTENKENCLRLGKKARTNSE